MSAEAASKKVLTSQMPRLHDRHGASEDLVINPSLSKRNIEVLSDECVVVQSNVGEDPECFSLKENQYLCSEGEQEFIKTQIRRNSSENQKRGNE